MRGKAFLKWTSIDLSSKLSLTYVRIINNYKTAHHPVPTPARGNREHPGNKLVNSPFNCVSIYILLHSVECVQIRSFSGLYFPAFELNTDNSYVSVFSPNAGKYGPEKTSYLDTFHAVSKITGKNEKVKINFSK